MSDLYRELILDHWRHPRHAAPLDHPTHVGEVINEACGDSVRVALVIRATEIDASSIQVSGCALAVAAGSRLAERIINQPVSTVRTIDEPRMLDWLGGIGP